MIPARPLRTFQLFFVILYGAYFCQPSYTQVVVIQGTDPISSSRTVLNNNFSYLDSQKVESASNTGSAGVGIFKTKLAKDLQFYKLFSSNSNLTIALSGTDFMNFTINPSPSFTNLTLTGNLTYAGSLSRTGIADGCGTWAAGVLTSTGTACGTGSGGSGGASTIADITDLKVTRSSGTQLAIGAATSTKPSTWGFGGKINSISTIPTVTLNSGSGTIYVYGTTGGSIVVGYPASGMSVTCALGCTTIGGITGFPDNVIRIAQWNAASGSWATTGTNLLSAFNRGLNLVAGTGVSIVQDETAGTTTVSATGGGTGGASTDAPQIICANSNIGAANSTNAFTTLASCTIPGGTLAINDTVRVTARFSHSGTTIAPRYEVQVGGTTQPAEVATGATTVGNTLYFYFVVTGSASQKGSGYYAQDANGTPLNVGGMSTISEAISGPIVINLLGRMTTTGSDSVVCDWHITEVIKSK